MPVSNNAVGKMLFLLLFLFFMALLTKNILFKKSPRYYKNYFKREYQHYHVSEGWKQANTTPFYTIKLFYNSRNLSTEYKSSNLLGNLVGFMPLGFLLPLLARRFRNIFIITLTGILVSLFFETTQLLLGLGIFDVDDLILNSTGCLVGYIFFSMALLLFKKSALPKAGN